MRCPRSETTNESYVILTIPKGVAHCLKGNHEDFLHAHFRTIQTAVGMGAWSNEKVGGIRGGKEEETPPIVLHIEFPTGATQ